MVNAKQNIVLIFIVVEKIRNIVQENVDKNTMTL